MIISGGVVGLCVFVGGLRHREQHFRIEGAGPAFDVPLVLGLDAKEIALMALAFLVGTIALGTGRTSMMQGAVQLVIFAAFLFLALVP